MQFKDGKIPPTYCKQGIVDNKGGPGRTRIDSVLLNKPALALFKQVRYLYGLLGAGKEHVALAVDLDLDRFTTTAWNWMSPLPLPVDSFPIIPHEYQPVIVRTFCGDLLKEFQKACEAEDIEKADSIWHQMADRYIRVVLKWSEIPCAKAKTGDQRRGEMPIFEKQSVCAPQCVELPVGASGALLKTHINMVSRGAELLVQLRRIEGAFETERVLGIRR